MPRIGPIKSHELIRYPRELGFQGPYPGRKHQIMQRGLVTLRIPNPHEGDIPPRLLSSLLREAGINKKEWEAL